MAWISMKPFRAGNWASEFGDSRGWTRYFILRIGRRKRSRVALDDGPAARQASPQLQQNDSVTITTAQMAGASDKPTLRKANALAAGDIPLARTGGGGPR